MWPDLFDTQAFPWFSEQKTKLLNLAWKALHDMAFFITLSPHSYPDKLNYFQFPCHLLLLLLKMLLLQSLSAAYLSEFNHHRLCLPGHSPWTLRLGKISLSLTSRDILSSLRQKLYLIHLWYFQCQAKSLKNICLWKQRMNENCIIQLKAMQEMIIAVTSV